MEVETEKWVHDCCLKITTQSSLIIYLKPNYDYNYPKINVYFRLHKPLSSIKLNQAADLVMQNTMKTDKCVIELAGASHAQVKIEIISNLYVYISGAADMIMSGYVSGAANINVREAGELDARSCMINIVFVEITGAGVAYIDGKQFISTGTSQAGKVYQKGSIRYETLNIFDRIKTWFGLSSTASRTLDLSINNFLILFFIIYFFLF